jgi:hypothetical protein
MARFILEDIANAVSDLRYIDSEGLRINATVKYELFAEPHPTTLDPADPAEHIQSILEQVLDGDFGPIAPYAPTVAELQNKVTGEALRVIARDIDPHQRPLDWADLTAEQQAELGAYRTALLGLSELPAFQTDPASITMPTEPAWI